MVGITTNMSNPLNLTVTFIVSFHSFEIDSRTLMGLSTYTVVLTHSSRRLRNVTSPIFDFRHVALLPPFRIQLYNLPTAQGYSKRNINNSFLAVSTAPGVSPCFFELFAITLSSENLYERIKMVMCIVPVKHVPTRCTEDRIGYQVLSCI